jgi:leucyl aminopeptidase
MKLVSDLKLNRHIVGIMALTENLPGGNAYKPGDILKHYNGKTSEILSTDAEGRLVLADGLSYGVEKFDPYAVIDFATLTGAAVIALGNNIAGLMGSNDDLISELEKASAKTWEKIWHLPIDQDIMDQIKSKVADIKNTGGRAGGSLTAGAFLRNFVDDRPWAHLDIAGTAWTQANTVKSGYLPNGATGFGVRLIYEYLTAS